MAGGDWVSRDEIQTMNRELVHRMDSGFQNLGITLRSIETEVKATNGRLRKVEVDASANGVRVTNLEREVFPRGRRPIAMVSAGGPMTVTLRDVAVVVATVGAVIAIQDWLIPFIERIVRP